MSDQSLRWRLTGGGFLLAGLLVYALLTLFSVEPQLAPIVRQAPLVETQRVVFREDTIEVRGQGFVRPQFRVDLAAQVSGQVVHVSPSLEPGGTFAEGEVLLELDRRPYQAAVDQTQGEIRGTRAQLEFARKEVQRLSKLAETNSASVSALGQQQSELGRLEGQLASLQAALQMNELNLERTRILAPFEGQVFDEGVDVGNIVQPGQGIAQIFSTSVFEVIVSLDDDEAALIPDLWMLSAETAASAKVVAQFGGQRYAWPAVAQGVEAAIDRQTRTVNLVVRVPDPTAPGTTLGTDANPAPPLLPGMYVNVEVAGRKVSRMAAIPRRALRGENSVWIATAAGVLEIIPVEVVQTSEDVAFVSQHVAGTELQVIVSELSEVREGMQIRTAELAPSGERPSP